MEAIVEKGDIDVEDIAILKWTMIRNAVTDNFVGARAYGFWEVAVVEWRWIGLYRALTHAVLQGQGENLHPALRMHRAQLCLCDPL